MSREQSDTVDIGVYVPPEILQRKELSDREKILLAAIVQLYRKNRECYASNEYFSRWLGIPQKEVSVNVSSLVKEFLIHRKIIYKKGSKQIDKRYLTPNYRQLKLKKKRFKGVSRISGGGLPQSGLDNRE